MKRRISRLVLVGLFAFAAVGSASAALDSRNTPLAAAEVATPRAGNPWAVAAGTPEGNLLAYDHDRRRDRDRDWDRDWDHDRRDYGHYQDYRGLEQRRAEWRAAERHRAMARHRAIEREMAYERRLEAREHRQRARW